MPTKCCTPKCQGCLHTGCPACYGEAVPVCWTEHGVGEVCRSCPDLTEHDITLLDRREADTNLRRISE